MNLLHNLLLANVIARGPSAAAYPCSRQLCLQLEGISGRKASSLKLNGHREGSAQSYAENSSSATEERNSQAGMADSVQ